MQLRCNYHSVQWAEWHCDHCGRDFCRQCVPGGHDYKLRAGGPKCVLCLNKLEHLGSAVGAPRPGQQFVVNLLFPFHINSLIVLLPLALATLPFLLLIKTPFVGFAIIPLFVIFTLIVEYAGAIMHARSEGKKQPPHYGEVIKGVDFLYLIKHLLTVMVGIWVTKYAVDINPLFGFLVGAVCLYVLPAALVILAIDRSLTRAINPLLLLSMVRPFIRDYCIFYVMALILATFFWVTFDILLAISAGLILSLLWYLGVFTAVYACYAMLGYLMFYYQYDLGNSFVIDRGEMLDKGEYEKLRALGDSDILSAEGRFEEARHILRTTMDSVDKDLAVHKRYHTILLQTDDVEAIKNHTVFYINLLLQYNDIKAASKVYRATLQRLPDFLPNDPAVRMALAEQLAKELDYQNAIMLLKGFHEIFPQSALTPEAYLLAAKLLHEYLHDSHRAAALLKFVVDNYPNADQLEAVKRYQSKVQKLL